MVHEIISTIIKEPILELELQKTAYSNYVYTVRTRKGVFIFKQYASDNHLQHELEVYIQTEIGFPEIVYNDRKHRLEKYAEHNVPDWDKHLITIAIALKKFHGFRIDCEYSQKDMLNKIMKKNIDIRNNAGVRKIYEFTVAQIGDKLDAICHNDLQIGNMMSIRNEIKFIDFEYSCKGNSCIDIANLFCETMCDYKKDFLLSKARGYNPEQRRLFLKIYYGKEDVESELLVIKKCEVFSHFYWFLWSRQFVMNGRGPSKTFDYRRYANSRLSHILDAGLISNEEYAQLKVVKK